MKKDDPRKLFLRRLREKCTQMGVQGIRDLDEIIESGQLGDIDQLSEEEVLYLLHKPSQDSPTSHV